MKKLIFLTLIVSLFGFSNIFAQTPDAPYFFTAVGTPTHVASTDLDNDRVPDLVFVTFFGDSIYTMLGNGDGTFSTRRAFGFGAVATGSVTLNAVGFIDFDNNGNMDVVAASRNSVNGLVWLGNGNGILSFLGTVSGSPAYWIRTGNFDPVSPPNLTPDVALLLGGTVSANDSVIFWFNNFTASVKVPTGGNNPFQMTKLTDPATGIDHIAVANGASGNLGIIISNGNQSFQPTVVIPARPDCYGIGWDFLNNDNFPDLVYSGLTRDSVFVQLGTSWTTYNPPVSYPVGSTPFIVGTGDFTGDGHIDIAVGHEGFQGVKFLINNGSGGFLPAVDGPTGFTTYGVEPADINLNGLPDLLVGADNSNNIAIFNLLAPSVSPSTIPGNPATGANLPLPTITARDSTNIASVKLVHRQLGKTNFDTLTLTAGAGTATLRDYSGTLPGAALTNRGLEYFFRTSDGFVTANQPATFLRRLRTTVAENAPATPDRSYRLVSFPIAFSPTTDGAASVQIADDFGSAGSDSWRLFWWDPIKADTITTDTTSLKGYREFGSAGFPNFSPGRSMFLATAGSRTYDGNGLSNIPNRTIFFPIANGDSVAVDYFQMVIDSGWNMIATPFPYTIHMDSVDVIVPAVGPEVHELDTVRQNRIGFGGANLRERTATGYAVPSPPLLKPWRGYFLKNNIDNPVTLLFPVKDGNFPLVAPPAPKAFAAGLDWKIDITAKSGDWVTPPTTIGTSKDAQKGYDLLDWELPPALEGDLRVSFKRGTDFGAPGEFLTDIRPTLAESESWSFTVQPGASRAIELNFDGLNEVPEDYDLILADVEGRTRQNLRIEPVYRFIASVERHFTLTITPKNPGSAAALMPTTYDLYQNFPNPFNPQTLIKYDLPEAADVRLDVFNILGQKVATLVNAYQAAGPKSVVWNGTDAGGAKVASGVYFYKINAGSYSATKKMMFIK